MAIGMAIGVSVEALLSSGESVAESKPLPKDEKRHKRMDQEQTQSLASLPGRLGVKLLRHCLASLG